MVSIEYPSSVPYDPETRREWTELTVPLAEYEARLKSVRAALEAEGLDALLVVGNAGDPASVSYLANYRPHFGSTFLLIPRAGEPVAISDAILHGEPMHSMHWDIIFDDLRPASAKPGAPPGTITELTAEAIRERGLGSARFGIDSPASLSWAHGQDLRGKLPDVAWRDATAIMLRARAIKSEAEIALMRRACEITRVALEAGLEACRPGATEREVAAVIHGRLLAEGAEAIGFDTAVSSGPRAGLKHAAPTDRALQPGDFVFLDTGAVVGGYHADLSRTLTVGDPDAEAEAMLETSLEMFQAALKAVRPGAPVRDIYRAAERVARRSGLIADYMPNGLGHGVGLALFELPFLGPDDESRLEPGMIFALEPMLVRYGFGTAVVEETVLVTDGGAEVLSGARW